MAQQKAKTTVESDIDMDEDLTQPVTEEVTKKAESPVPQADDFWADLEDVIDILNVMIGYSASEPSRVVELNRMLDVAKRMSPHY